MKKITKLLNMLLCVAIFAACTDDDRGKVISQDVSYQPDANYIYVDIPEEFQFDPSNILYLQGTTVLKLNGEHDGEHLTIAEGTEFTFNVGLKKAVGKDMLVRLKYDPTLLDEYQNAANLAICPEENLILSDVTLKAGEREGKSSLTFQNIDALSEAPGYILPLRLEFVDAVDGVKISSNNYCVFVELGVKINRSNIDFSNDPVEGTSFVEGVMLDSDKPSGLNKLIDGSISGSWYPRNASTYLTMTFSEPTKILGIKIDLDRYGSYLLGKLNVYADEGNGFVSYGTVDRNTGGAPMYIRFKKPVVINAVKFDGMLCVDGEPMPDIYEITFIR